MALLVVQTRTITWLTSTRGNKKSLDDALITAPEEKHQRAEKRLKVVVLIDVTLVIQLDVPKHLQKTSRFP